MTRDPSATASVTLSARRVGGSVDARVGRWPFPEPDVSRECTPISNVGGFKSLDGQSRGSKLSYNIRLEEHLCRVVVRCMALLLEVDNEVGKALDLLRETPEQSLLTACLARPTVGQRPVGQVPGASPSKGLADQSIRATLRQAVEEGVVDGAHRAAKASSQRPPAARGELLLGGDEEIRGLQDASLPHRIA